MPQSSQTTSLIDQIISTENHLRDQKLEKEQQAQSILSEARQQAKAIKQEVLDSEPADAQPPLASTTGEDVETTIHQEIENTRKAARAKIQTAVDKAMDMLLP